MSLLTADELDSSRLRLEELGKADELNSSRPIGQMKGGKLETGGRVNLESADVEQKKLMTRRLDLENNWNDEGKTWIYSFSFSDFAASGTNMKH